LELQSSQSNGSFDNLPVVAEFFGTFLERPWDGLAIGKHDVLVAIETAWHIEMTGVIEFGKVGAAAKAQDNLLVESQGLRKAAFEIGLGRQRRTLL